MRYRFRRKYFSFRTDFAIKDEDGETAYTVVTALLSFGDSISLTRLDGSVAAKIEQKLMSWRALYEIEREGTPPAILKSRGWFRRGYALVVEDGPTYQIRRGVWGASYRFRRDGVRVGLAWLPRFSFRREFVVDVEPDGDDVLILASTIALLKIRERAAQRSATDPGHAGPGDA